MFSLLFSAIKLAIIDLLYIGISTIIMIVSVITMFWRFNVAGRKRFDNAMVMKLDKTEFNEEKKIKNIELKQIKKDISKKKDTEIINEQISKLLIRIEEVRAENTVTFGYIKDNLNEFKAQSEKSDNAIFKLLKEMRAEQSNIIEKIFNFKK